MKEFFTASRNWISRSAFRWDQQNTFFGSKTKRQIKQKTWFKPKSAPLKKPEVETKKNLQPKDGKSRHPIQKDTLQEFELTEGV